MRVFIPTRVAANRMQTISIKLPWERYFVTHTMEQCQSLMKMNIDSKDNFLVTGTQDITQHRNFINQCVESGEWYLRADDNIRSFVGSNGDTLSSDEAWRIIQEAILEAEKRRAKLVGFATVDNPFFRKTKYRDVGFVIGKMFAVKHDPQIESTGKVITMDDYERTAQHLYKYGRVLICNALHSKAKHYEPGGLGTWEERLEQKKRDCMQLFEDWPQLFREKRKSGKETGSEVQIRFTDLEQVEKWRLYMTSRYRVNGVTQ